MPPFINFLMIVLLIGILVCFFALMRNNWVYSVRVRMIHEDFEKFKRLPSYDHMMSRFWIWNVNKFLPRNGP